VKDAPLGAVLWKDGHVGMKYTQTQQIEDRGVDFGVCIKDITSQKWVTALVFDNVDYGDKEIVFLPYVVKVTAAGLNVRKEPVNTAKIITTIRDKGKYKITAEKNGWGNIGNGWINLEFTERSK
jgi:hypothetical protein